MGTGYGDMELIYGPRLKMEEKRGMIQKITQFLERKKVTIVFAMVSAFILAGPWILVSIFFIPPFWFLGIIYFSYIWYFDSETPHRGGRKSKWIKNCFIWKYSRDYFPIRMVKTADLKPDQNYIFCTFPHGLFSFGAQANFTTNVNDFSKAFPGLDVHVITLSANFKIPFLREFLLALGCCSAREESLLHILNNEKKGQVCVLVIGGVAEAMKISNPGTYDLVLKDRKGFVRIALKTGCALVPVFSFGECDTYVKMGNDWWNRIAQLLRSKLGLPLVLVKGRGFSQNYYGLLPHQVPITTVVGKPINVPKINDPTVEDIDKYHGMFIEELQRLFDHFKGKYDLRGFQAQLHLE